MDSILKNRDIILPTKVWLVKAMVFPVVMYACESWTINKAECQRIDAFELWCWRRLLRVLWPVRRSYQSILKEINPEYSLEVQFTSVGQPCPTLCDPMDYSTPGLPVHHQLLAFTKTHVHWVGDAIQPSHPLLSPSPAFNPSQHQDLFRWFGSSHEVVKILELQLQHQSFQWRFRTDFLYDWLVWSPWSPRDSQESSPTPEFKSINSLALSFIYGTTLTSIHNYWKSHSLD